MADKNGTFAKVSLAPSGVVVGEIKTTQAY